MARKKTLPKVLGPLKIPKSLRRLGNKALADPQVVTILSSALASVGVALAARKVVEEVSADDAVARSAARSRTLGTATDVVRQALDDAMQARHPTPQQPKRREPGKAKRRKPEPDAGAPAPEASQEGSADHLH